MCLGQIVANVFSVQRSEARLDDFAKDHSNIEEAFE